MRLHSTRSIFAAALVCTALTSCGWFSDPPTQLESVMTLDAPATDAEDRNALRETVLDYLAIEGLRREQLRVVYDEATHRNALRVVGKAALPPALLQQIAKKLEGYAGERNWKAQLVFIDEAPELDALLGTKERNFDLTLDWGQADIDAYVVTQAFDSFSGLATLSSDRPRTVRCMLSFKPAQRIPETEYSFEDLAGKSSDAAESNDPQLREAQRQMRAFFKNMRGSIEHRLSYEGPLLKEAFKEEIQVKNGKLMFMFATIESKGVFDPNYIGADRQRAPMDISGRVHDECAGKLKADFPKIDQRYAARGMFQRIAAFGPVSLPAVPQ